MEFVIEVGNLMVKKEYVLHIVDKLKCGIKSEIKKKNLRSSIRVDFKLCKYIISNEFILCR